MNLSVDEMNLEVGSTLDRRHQSVRPLDLARLMLCVPFYIILGLMVIEALLGAITTYLLIEAAVISLETNC